MLRKHADLIIQTFNIALISYYVSQQASNYDKTNAIENIIIIIAMVIVIIVIIIKTK